MPPARTAAPLFTLSALALLLFLLLLVTTLSTANASTPHSISVDGTISTTNEWDNAAERLGTRGGLSYYVTWNATTLFVGLDGYQRDLQNAVIASTPTQTNTATPPNTATATPTNTLTPTS